MAENASGLDLGPLESEVMGIVWEHHPVTVRDVLERLGDHQLAYNTIMTVLSRLFDKGYLERHRSGRAYVYEPAVSRQHVTRSILQELADKFFGGAVKPLVSTLLSLDEELSPGELERLLQLTASEEGPEDG